MAMSPQQRSDPVIANNLADAPLNTHVAYIEKPYIDSPDASPGTRISTDEFSGIDNDIRCAL
jgi:hypothetical protein